MKLVMTLLAQDQADVVESWLTFHLNAGADFVIATDNRSMDGTTDVLERFAREGHVHLIREPGEDLRQNEWVTRMARLAATDFGADWVHQLRRRRVLVAARGVAPRRARGDLSAVRDGRRVPAGLRPAAGRRGTPSPSASTVRFSALAPINDPASLYKPIRKIVHRAHPEISGHPRQPCARRQPLRAAPWLVPDRGLHFPLRWLAQCEHKAELQGTAFEKYIDRPPTAYHAQMFDALKSGSLAEYYGAGRRRPCSCRGGCRGRTARVDTGCATRFAPGRAGGRSRSPTPTLVDEATYAVEAATLGEADVVRLQRRLRHPARNVLRRHRAGFQPVYRKVTRPVKRVLRR